MAFHPFMTGRVYYIGARRVRRVSPWVAGLLSLGLLGCSGEGGEGAGPGAPVPGEPVIGTDPITGAPVVIDPITGVQTPIDPITGMPTPIDPITGKPVPVTPTPATVVPDVKAMPGTVVMPEPLHRLNRLEYNNSVRDLMAATGNPADIFPTDPPLDGFDNMANGLTLSSTLFGLYSDAARDLANGALSVQPRFRFSKLAKDVATGGHEVGSRGWSLYDPALKPPPGNGDVHDLVVPFELAEAETVSVSVSAGGTISKADTPVMGVQIDSLPKQTFTVDNPVAAPKDFTLSAELPAGSHSLKVTFENFEHRPTKNVVNILILRDVKITSEATALPAARGLIQTCDPKTAPDAKACYAQIVTTFARRAWRRPLAPEESSRLVGLWETLSATEGEEAALQLTIRAVLVSPHFLYRTSKPLAGAQPSAPGEPVPLDDFSIASRLSYWLWASMPDDELLAAAEQGQLRETAGLSAQLQRMLLDPKANGLLEGFAAQWLNSRKLKNSRPDAKIFPDFDEPLKAAMQQETLSFFGDFLSNGKPVGDLLTPDFNYVNDRLANHYGLSAPGSEQLVKVPRMATERGGLVMLGAWLTAQSEPDRTSPVLRGRWLTEQLMCLSVPPPPADVTPVSDAPEDATIREVLAAHRADAKCAGCHNILDPPGLGLEEFDGIGKQRTEENGVPIDSSGGIPSGPDFVGGVALAEALREDPRFYSCMTDKIATYALGRRLVKTDGPMLDKVSGAVNGTQTTLAQLLEWVAVSPVFRMVSPNAAPASAPAAPVEN